MTKKPQNSKMKLPKLPKLDLKKIRLPKLDPSKITPAKIVVVQCIIASVLAIVLLVLLVYTPDDGIPDLPTGTTTVTEGTTGNTTAGTTTGTEPTETEPPRMLPKMEVLYASNPDTIGWITIPDTKVDYPVMYTPYEPEKYIHANFKEQFSIGGLPFIEDACSMDPESDNLIIYAHNMNDGSQFQNITNYAYKRFGLEHPTIQFSTLYEERTYEVVAAFPDKVYKPTEDVFKFYQFIDYENEEEFNEAMTYFKEKSAYDTGVTPVYGDKFITLVTCAYHVKNGRFVVVARQVTPEVTLETE